MAQAPQGGGKFIKASELMPGERCKVTGEADWVDTNYKNDDGTPRSQFVAPVEYKGEERRLKITVASSQTITPIYGKDSLEWIGKELELEAVKVMVGGQVKQSILATPLGVQKETAATPSDDVAWDE